jgi:hypothetical protein
VGAELSITVPGGVVWRVQALSGILTTSAVAGTRIPFLQITDGTTIAVKHMVAAGQGVNTANTYSWIARGGAVIDVSGSTFKCQPFADVPIPAGFVIRTVTAGIDVGDQWSAIVIYVIEIVQRSEEKQTAFEAAIAAGVYTPAYTDLG